ncbi:MAG: DUF4153 domain-containing protein, partial [Flammeovirgaceae bacterium]|nr:DUF4153 domain-containing protein [Flammeovirgaceae bacterium]MDW8287496.1 DUF4153 domain-containing protein [Flammeovirgaceae bacterium]
IKNKEENKWIKQFSKVFYFAIFPLIGLLIVSIWKRVSDYGITEPRYFVVVLALWLTGISLYFLLSKEKNIRYVPISLAFVVLFSAYSPWNAFVVSHNSQYRRFVKIAEENKLLQNGKFSERKESIPLPVSDELNSILTYFERNHDLRKFQPLYYISIDSLFKVYEKEKKLVSADSLYYMTPKEKLAELAGFYATKGGQIQKDSEGNYIFYRYFYLKNTLESVEVEGFEEMYKISVYSSNYTEYVSTKGTKVKIDSTYVRIESDNESHTLSLEPFIKDLMQNVSTETYEYLPLENMTFETKNEKFRLRMYVSYLALATAAKKSATIKDLEGWLLLEKN